MAPRKVESGEYVLTFTFLLATNVLQKFDH